MKLNELAKSKIYSHKDKTFVRLQDIDINIDDLEGDEDYIILRHSGRLDKDKKPVFEGHILRMNPDDDDWLDIVIYKERLRDLGFKYSLHQKLELLSYEAYNSTTNFSLVETLEKNLAVIVGHVLTHPHLAFRVLQNRHG